MKAQVLRCMAKEERIKGTLKDGSVNITRAIRLGYANHGFTVEKEIFDMLEVGAFYDVLLVKSVSTEEKNALPEYGI